MLRSTLSLRVRRLFGGGLGNGAHNRMITASEWALYSALFLSVWFGTVCVLLCVRQSRAAAASERRELTALLGKLEDIQREVRASDASEQSVTSATAKAREGKKRR